MKIINILFVLIGLTALSACSQTSSSKVQNLSATEFAQKIKAKNAVVIDVRTPQEVMDGFIEGTDHFFNINDSKFVDNISKLDKTKEYYIYCRSGARSGKAANVMASNGFKKVYNLNGGLNDWTGKLVKN